MELSCISPIKEDVIAVYIRNIWRISFLACMFFPFQLWAAIDTVYLEIAVSGVQVVPVGILPFEKERADLPNLDEQPDQILNRDFFLSGRITTELQPSYNRLAFFKANAAYYVSGTLDRTPDGKLAIACRLMATQSKELVLGEDYQVPANQMRQAIHDFADKVIWQITGNKGVATSRLAYVGMVNGEKQIFVSDYDGYNRMQVTKATGINIMPTWGSDPDKLYFTSFRNGYSQIFERTLSNGSVRQLFSRLGQQSFCPATNSQNKQILFASVEGGVSNIWLGDAKAGWYHKVTYDKTSKTSPAWAPNGNEILFTGDRGRTPQIYTMQSDGSDIRRITYLGHYNDAAAWSPSGDRIAYVSQDGTEFNIYTCALDGSDVVQLTSHAGSNQHPVWSPDGMLIAFSSNRSGSSQIYLMRRDGSGVTRITNGSEYSWPSWSHIIPQSTEKGVQP